MVQIQIVIGSKWKNRQILWLRVNIIKVTNAKNK